MGLLALLAVLPGAWATPPGHRAPGTGHAAHVGSDRAELADLVSGDGAPFSWHFEYGPTADYGTSTPEVSAPGSNGDVRETATVTGLTPGATYHARLVWIIQGTTERADDFTFVTLPEGGGAAPADLAPEPEASDRGAGGDASHPHFAKSAVGRVASGRVRVRIPGWRTSAPLVARSRIPFGSVVDTREGAVTLTTSLADDSPQTATFSGGIFEVRQPALLGGVTDIILTHASRRGCPAASAPAASGGARTAAVSRRRRVLSRLWGADKGGRYRTHGANSVATVRGTRWLTEERCDGTLTKVTEGAVSVFDRRLGRRVMVRTGMSYLARHR